MYLTDLWFILPDWAFKLLIRVLRLDAAVIHEVLCEIWSCRCPQR